MTRTRFPHLILNAPPDARAYTRKAIVIDKAARVFDDAREHGTYLQRKMEEAWAEAQNEWGAYHVDRKGVYIEFKSPPGSDLITRSLEDMRSGIRLLNVRTVTESGAADSGAKPVICASVFVPKDKVNAFTTKLIQYTEQVTKNGSPRNADLCDSIAEIARAVRLESFWVDEQALMPLDLPTWCEVWLRDESGIEIEQFELLLSQLQIESRAGLVSFPERTVKVILANRAQLEQLVSQSHAIAEFRSAKTTAAFWSNMSVRDQVPWLEDLLSRIDLEAETRVSICILDTGINNGHPLLAPVLDSSDCHSADPSWGSHGHHKHGTLMAGLAAYGNLVEILESRSRIKLLHRLESVKILPPPPRQTQPDLWGYVTAQGISRAEIQAPMRNRTFCMAVTSRDGHSRGRPTSWSAELDQLTSGATDDTRRLIVVAAGNGDCTDPNIARHYPDSQLTDPIQDPAQAWNVLTVGAHTMLDTLQSAELSAYQPVAPSGALSPFTTTSNTWEDRWPIKPDIVMEGGNLAIDVAGWSTDADELSVLSTYFDPGSSYFYPFNMTSAATAQAAWFAAQIQARYPDFWPETVRALVIHSADWPEGLLRQLGGNGSKSDMKRVLRSAGYGVPDLERALYSATNSLTLVAQREIQPFDRREGGAYVTKEMHLYHLPWPKEVLQELPDNTSVKMRVTLSYFIEPGPGEIGWRDRYRYASHGLQFDVNLPGESDTDFLKRINAADLDGGEAISGSPSTSRYWKIGSNTRNRGSIHSDLWEGTPAELASSSLIAVFPRIGWWRERSNLMKWDKKTRYALIVSIHTPVESVDIYTPVAIQVGTTIPVSVEIT